MVQGERLLDLFAENGLANVSSSLLPVSAKCPVKPFSLSEDLVVVPGNRQRYAAIRIREEAPSEGSPKGQSRETDYQPIHIFLKPDSMERCKRSRPQHSDPGGLGAYPNALFGVHGALMDGLGLVDFS